MSAEEDVRAALDPAPEALRTAVADEVVKSLVRPAPKRVMRLDSMLASVNETDVYYAANDTDAKTLASVVAVAVGLVTWNVPVALGGLIVLLFQYRKKKVQLSGLQGAVLLTLRRAPKGTGWTLDEIQQQLPAELEVEDEELKQVLSDLDNATSMDGSAANLVGSLNDAWWAQDV